MCSLKASPIVTVLMAVHNGATHIGEAIDSILAQSFEDFELVIVDDGSTDETWSLIDAYRDERVRAARCPHRGLARSLNEGLSKARGRYIARMDADDVAERDRLRAQVEHLCAHPEHVLVSSWVVFIGEDGRSVQPGVWVIPCSDEELRERLYRENQLCHGATAIRADSLRAVGGYRDKFTTAEDYDLWLRLNEVGGLAAIPRPLVRIRRHPGSKTAGEGIRVLRFAMLAQRLAFERRQTGRDRLGYSCPEQAQPRLEELRSLTVPDPLGPLDWARWFHDEGNHPAAAALAVTAVRLDPRARAAWRLLIRSALTAAGPHHVRCWLRTLAERRRRGHTGP